MNVENWEIREIHYGSAEYGQEIQLRAKVLREPLRLRFTLEELSRDANDIHLGAFSGKELLGCLILSASPQNSTQTQSGTPSQTFVLSQNPLQTQKATPPQKIMKMRQVAVDKGTQRRGVGKKLVEVSEEKARQLGFTMIELHARATAVSFYQKLGYEVYGELFEEVTLPHRKMRKHLI